MTRIPLPSVAPSPQGTQPLTSTVAPERVGATTGDELGALGSVLARAGEVAAALFERERQLTDAVIAREALIELDEKLGILKTDPEKGLVSYRGRRVVDNEDGAPVSVTFAQRAAEHYDEIAKRLSPTQRMEFDARAQVMLSNFRQQVRAYETESFTKYQDGVLSANLDREIRDFGVLAQRLADAAASGGGDVQQLRDGVDVLSAGIREAVEERARFLGLSDEEKDALFQKSFATAAFGAILTVMRVTEDPAPARALLNAWHDKLDPDQYRQLSGALYSLEDSYAAFQAYEIDRAKSRRGVVDTPDGPRFYKTPAEEVVSEVSKRLASQGGLERVLGITLNLETSPGQRNVVSRNRNGTVDIGPYQINSASGPALAARIGERWDPERARTDESYNRALAEAHLRTSFERHGDWLAAAVAYLVGDGAVSKAKAAAAQSGRSWVEHLSAAGQKRAADVARAAGMDLTARRGLDIPPRTPRAPETEGEIRAYYSGMVEQGMLTPRQARILQQARLQRLSDDKAAQENAREKAYQEALGTLIETGGDMAAITPAVRGMLKSTQIYSLMGISDALQNRKTSDPRALALLSPEYLANSTPEEVVDRFGSLLSRADLAAVLTSQQEIKSKSPVAAEGISSAAVNGALKTAYAAMGKSGEPSVSLVQAVYAAAVQAQMEKNRRLSSDELAELAMQIARVKNTGHARGLSRVLDRSTPEARDVLTEGGTLKPGAIWRMMAARGLNPSSPEDVRRFAEQRSNLQNYRSQLRELGFFSPTARHIEAMSRLNRRAAADPSVRITRQALIEEMARDAK